MAKKIPITVKIVFGEEPIAEAMKRIAKTLGKIEQRRKEQMLKQAS